MTIIIAAVSAFLGLNVKIVYNWLLRRGNGHTSPCDFVKESQGRIKNCEDYLLEILQRVVRIETKIDHDTPVSQIVGGKKK